MVQLYPFDFFPYVHKELIGMWKLHENKWCKFRELWRA
jgi:hypothetical protein